MCLDKKAHAALLPEQIAPAMTQSLRHVAIRKMLIPDLCTVSYSLQTPAFFHPCTSFLKVKLILSLCPGKVSTIYFKISARTYEKNPNPNPCEIIRWV